VLTAELKSDTS